MKLPNSFTTVTSLSKVIAFFLFIFFPVVSFYLGIKYQQGISPKTIYLTKEKVVNAPQKESASDLVSRCGDFPPEASIDRGHFSVITGRLWSPDCRNIAWGIWFSGTSVIEGPAVADEKIPTSPTRPFPTEGLYIYNDGIKQIQQVYKLKTSDMTIEFKEWKDRHTIIFSTNNGIFSYNLNSKTVSPVTE